MRTLWLLGIVSQAVLILSYRERDAMFRYLCFGLLLSLIRWSCPAEYYFHVWMLTEPLAIGLLIHAALEYTADSPRVDIAYGVAGAVALSIVLLQFPTPASGWHTARLIMTMGGSILPLGIMSAGAVAGCKVGWPLAFVSFRAARATWGALDIPRTSQAANEWYMAACVGLFIVWATANFAKTLTLKLRA